MKRLHMYTNDDGGEWVIAYNAKDARNLYLALLGPDGGGYEHRTTPWKRVSRKMEFTYTPDEGSTKRTETVDTWIEAMGRGYFASYNY